MLDENLKRFFTELIKKHSKDDKEVPETYLKSFIEEWVIKASKNAKQITLATHVGKLTHPNARISPFIASSPYLQDGYVRTGNTEVEDDYICSATAIPIQKFLTLELSDGRTVYEHIEQQSKYIMNQLSFPSISFSDMRLGFLTINKKTTEFVTSDQIRQVYFPVKDSYHLLSIVDPSGILFGLKDRINQMKFNEDLKPVKKAKKDNAYTEETFSDIYDLTSISFGGSKPQNISILNNKHGGAAYLLPSLPPVTKSQKIKLPYYDFFYILKSKKFRYLFLELYKIIRSYKNNFDIRNKRDEVIQEIIYIVIDQVQNLRQVKEGWSNSEKCILLPHHQKIWLDSIYEKERADTSLWLRHICKDFSQGVRDCYNNISKDEKTDLDEEEHLLYFSVMFEKNKELLI
jgi:CRISPR-associated protein Csy1